MATEQKEQVIKGEYKTESTKKARENAKIDSAQVLKIPLSKVAILENFNVRQDYGDLDELANSLLNNGQLIPAIVDYSEGKYILVEGHRRYKAFLKIWNDTGNEPYLRATVNGTRTSMEDRIFQMFISQDNKKLEPYEISDLFQRLENLGYTAGDIATKTGKSASYVYKALAFQKLPQKLKNDVKKGTISLSTALESVQDVGLEETMEKIDSLKKSGVKKISKGAIKRKPMDEALNRLRVEFSALENPVTGAEALEIIEIIFEEEKNR